MLRYTRMLVEISLEGDFPDFIEFANEKDVIIRQKVVYEWKPIKCTHSKVFGNIREDCRKLVSHRQDWRAVTTRGETPNQQNHIAKHGQ